MRVYKDMDTLPDFRATIVTIGSFDGVHSGHQKILKRMIQRSIETGLENVVITFHPHPRSIVYPKDDTLRLLSTLEEKIELFSSIGIDHLVVAPFSIEFSQISPLGYIERFLVDKFLPKLIIIGYDHKFGLNRQGDLSLLRSHAGQHSYEVIEISKHEIDDAAISSTRIRSALQEGNLEQSNLLLNRPYTLSGVVVKGQQIGTDLGFPTANVRVDDPKKLIPMNGIYICEVDIKDNRYRGMLYIGDVPTLGYNKQTIEVNIFDFDEDIYGEYISIHLIRFLRSDQKFDGLEALKTQLILDRDATLAFFDLSSATRNLDATIAILSYNSQDYLDMFLPSVLRSSDADFEICIIDNKSSDDTSAMLAQDFPEITFHQLDKNHGFAEGYNQGLVHVESKYVVLLNSDVEVTEGWLDPLIDFLENHEGHAAVMPKVLSYERKEYFEHAGASGGFLDKLGYAYCRGRIFDTVEKDEGQYDDVKDVGWTSGAAMVVRTDLYKSLGGFDGDYFAHYEEIDLCWRMRRAGYRLAVVPESVVYHVGGGTLSYESPRKVFLNFRNSLSTLFKNNYFPHSFLFIFLRLVLDGVAGLRYLVKGEWQKCWSIIKAHFSFYLSIPRLMSRKREEVKRIRNVRSKSGPTNSDQQITSIVKNYYLNQRSTYAELMKGA